jgi:hypothetical protein
MHGEKQAHSCDTGNRLEGVVARPRDSCTKQRSGAWVKVRLNRGQEFVIGGYIILDLPFAIWRKKGFPILCPSRLSLETL